MIDMHSHFLFGVDDGPATIEETMRIVEKAAAEGMTDLIATPHAFSPHFHVAREAIEGQIDLLADVVQAAGYPVALHTGQEVRLHEHLLDNLKTGKAMMLANSQYVLLELPTNSIPTYAISIIQSLLGEGLIPIIAHPERNRAIAEKPERLEKLVRNGALAQVTAGSLAGHFGKNVQKLALQLTEANLIHTYGSDVHNLKTRPFFFNEGLDYLEKKKHLDLVDVLLENNERILEDEAFFMLEPHSPKLKKWWQLKG